ncbi:hypothetical protein ACS0TY_031763 [Phlomoides rotata]
MASVQERREKVRDEVGILVEKDIVPKMATLFESLAEKNREDQLYVRFHGEKDVGSGIQGLGESESERKREGEAEKQGGESGIGAVGLVGKVVAQVKDEAVMVGWGTTQYTPEKVAEATKTRPPYAGEKIAATTNAVVVAEYAARKQVEARTEQEARRASHSHEIVNVEERKEQREAAAEKLMGGAEEEEQGQGEGEVGSILEAIGETIVEIGQTTKEFLLGLNPIHQKDETEFRDEI